MFWVGVSYTDGSRVFHAFRRCVFYKVGERLHVAGDAVCRCTFSEDVSGARRDVASAVFGTPDAIPAEQACDKCEAIWRSEDVN